MDSTCYSFGGEIFKQVSGAGIGLRASACMAKLLMGMLDKMWAQTQISWNLVVAIYLRYIDDLRVYIYPITAGYFWSDEGWIFTGSESDNRDPLTRTSEELAKTLNSCVSFVKFTTESENVNLSFSTF